MNDKAKLVSILLLLVILGVPGGSYATTITVDFGNACDSLSGASPLNFQVPFTCGNITITSIGGGAARVEADETAGDLLQMRNVLITANASVDDFHIKFRSDLNQPPTTSSGGNPVNVFYKPKADGRFSNNTPSGNWFTLKGFVTNPLTGETRQMGTTKTFTVSLGRYTFSLSASGQWVPPPDLISANDPRRLEVDLSFKLASGRTIDLGTGAYFAKMYDSPSAGDGDTPCPSAKKADCDKARKEQAAREKAEKEQAEKELCKQCGKAAK